MTMNSLCVGMVVLILSHLANANDGPLTPKPTIRLMAMSTLWRFETKQGYYRARLERIISEPSADFVNVEWLELEDDGRLRSTRDISLKTPGYKGYVADLSFHKLDEQRQVLYVDIEMKAMRGIVLREVFLLTSGGSSQRLVEANFLDIDP